MVNEIIANKLPVSLKLGTWALLITLALGMPLGMLTAVWHNAWLDYLCSSIGMMGVCIQMFMMGPLLALAFGIHLCWFNVSGWYGPANRIIK